MINRTLEEKLEELNTQLNRLTLQQDETNSRVIITRTEVTRLTEEIRAQTATDANINRENIDRRVTAVVGSGYHVGDQVVIINPSPGQENQGRVIGETRDGLLKIKPKSGKYIKRLPKNVRRDERSE